MPKKSASASETLKATLEALPDKVGELEKFSQAKKESEERRAASQTLTNPPIVQPVQKTQYPLAPKSLKKTEKDSCKGTKKALSML